MTVIQKTLLGSLMFLIGIPLNAFFLFGMLFKFYDMPLWDLNLIPLELIAVNFVMSFIGIAIVLYNWENLDTVLQSNRGVKG